ncbi:MAG: hypothetical protein AB7E52_05265 [Bdellovibrionales bacterium]
MTVSPINEIETALDASYRELSGSWGKSTLPDAVRQTHVLLCRRARKSPGFLDHLLSYAVDPKPEDEASAIKQAYAAALSVRYLCCHFPPRSVAQKIFLQNLDVAGIRIAEPKELTSAERSELIKHKLALNAFEKKLTAAVVKTPYIADKLLRVFAGNKKSMLSMAKKKDPTSVEETCVKLWPTVLWHYIPYAPRQVQGEAKQAIVSPGIDDEIKEYMHAVYYETIVHRVRKKETTEPELVEILDDVAELSVTIPETDINRRSIVHNLWFDLFNQLNTRNPPKAAALQEAYATGEKDSMSSIKEACERRMRLCGEFQSRRFPGLSRTYAPDLNGRLGTGFNPVMVDLPDVIPGEDDVPTTRIKRTSPLVDMALR